MENTINNTNVGMLELKFNVPDNKSTVINNKYYTWGRKQEYIKFLDKLYAQGAAVHRASIDRKIRFMNGKGLDKDLVPNLEEYGININKVLNKTITSFEKYNGFAYRIVFNRRGDKIVEFECVKLEHIAFGKIKEEDLYNVPHVFYSKQFEDKGNITEAEYLPIVTNKEDILLNKSEPMLYFYHDEFDPEKPDWPTVGYSNSLNAIQIAPSSMKFNLNTVQNGFISSFHVDFPYGDISEQKKAENYVNFMGNFTGEEALPFVITYSDPDAENKVTIEAIPVDNADGRFESIIDKSDEYIIQNHQIPLQIMRETAGNLAGTDERLELQLEFQNDYVSPRQMIIENVLNEIFGTVNLVNDNKYFHILKYVENVENVEDVDKVMDIVKAYDNGEINEIKAETLLKMLNVNEQQINNLL